jgi:hypothetical protein
MIVPFHIPELRAMTPAQIVSSPGVDCPFLASIDSTIIPGMENVDVGYGYDDITMTDLDPQPPIS